jgi:signal transduction protein with GAF and PtsI domain
MIPIDAGHPGRVRASGQPMLLANTDDHGDFRQYLKSSRMGSSIYAPLHWEGRFIGQIVMAAQARWTLRASDLAVLVALAPLAAALWIAKGGPHWLARHYPPADGFRVNAAGVDRGSGGSA